MIIGYFIFFITTQVLQHGFCLEQRTLSFDKSGKDSVLRLKCTSYAENWITPGSVKKYDVKTIDGVTYMMVDSKHQDVVGLYQCNRNHTTFVYTSDGRQILNKVNQMETVYHSNCVFGPILIPCLSAYPNVTMKVYWEEHEAMKAVDYTPNRGFVFEDTKIFHNGDIMKCKGTFTDKDGKTIEQVTRYKVVIAEPQIKIVKPYVLILEGTDAEVSVEYLQESDEQPASCTWRNGRNTILASTESFIKETIENGKTYKVYKSAVSISNANFYHGGDYKIGAHNNLKQLRVQVLPVSDNYITITRVSAPKTSASVEWGRVSLIVDYHCEAEPHVKWFDNHKNEIKLSRKYTIDHQSRTSTRLIISDLKANDTGNYTLVLSLLDESDDVTIPLTVTGISDLKFENKKFSLISKDKDTISCEVYSNPKASFFWKCLTFGEDEIAIEHHEDREVSPHYYVSTLTFQPKESFTFECTASNTNDTQTTTTKVYVTDVEDGFDLYKPEVIQGGDDVEFTCAVDKKFYKKDIEWSTTTSAPINNTRVHETAYSYHNTLTIKNITMEMSGVYFCTVQQTDLFNTNKDWKSFTIEVKEASLSEEDSITIIALVVLFVVIIIILTASLGYKIYLEKKKNIHLVKMLRGEDKAVKDDKPLGEQMDSLAYRTEYEFPIAQVKLGDILGQGAYGKVYKAQAVGIVDHEPVTTVAVKVTSRQCDMDTMTTLITELKIMSYIGKHLNVVNLLGACTKNLRKYELFIIAEYCENGNLHDYLLKHRSELIRPEAKGKMYESDGGFLMSGKLKGDNGNCYEDLLKWSFQIACGMEYLAGRRILHCDLATRNILLTADNIVKICDFGLSKNLYNDGVYLKEKRTLLPVKWMSIESIRDGVFTTQSDVWSFGVVLWEIFSLGAMPYPDLASQIKSLSAYLGDGHRMGKPQYCSDYIYNIMMECWREEPHMRPTFTRLVFDLGQLLSEPQQHYFMQLNEPNQQWNNEFLSSSHRPATRKQKATVRYYNTTRPRTCSTDSTGYVQPKPIKIDYMDMVRSKSYKIPYNDESSYLDMNGGR